MGMDTHRRSRAVCGLSGHPTVIDVVRVASTLTGSFVEVVVFDADRAMVVGSLNDGLLQPRPLTPAESILAGGDQREVRTNEETSTAIVDHQGVALGALTVRHGPTLPDVSEVLHGLSRIVASLVDVESEIEDLHETLLENLRDAVVVVDADMMISYANRSVGIQIGRSPVEIVGTSVIDLLHPDDVADALDSLVRLGTGAEVYRLAVRVLHGTGEYIRLEATGRDLTANPNVAGILLSLRNGDHDLELESSLERTRRVSNALVEQLHDGIVATDAVGSLLVVNESAREILGLPSGTYPAEMAVDSLEFFDTDVLPVERDRHPIRRALSGEHIVRENMTVVVDDVVRNIVVSGRPVENSGGQRIGAAIGFHDITEARRYQHELQHIALHDHLTGLPNRRQLKNLVAELPLTAAAGDTRPVAETLIDLDNFKVINDTHGHRVGDQVIRIAAHRLSACCSPDDLLVRLGGDEFVVLSRGQSVEEAVASADEMRRRLAEPIRHRRSRVQPDLLDRRRPSRSRGAARGFTPAFRRPCAVRGQGARPQPGDRVRPRARRSGPHREPSARLPSRRPRRRPPRHALPAIRRRCHRRNHRIRIAGSLPDEVGRCGGSRRVSRCRVGDRDSCGNSTAAPSSSHVTQLRPSPDGATGSRSRATSHR